MLSAARERLRRECLRGRIFGFTVQGADNVPEQSTTQAEDGEEDIESLFLRLPTSASATSVNQEWNKNSWRRTEGKKSRGRVKGIAKVFESSDIIDVLGRRRSISSREAELDEVSRIRRSRQDSTDSGISTVSSSSTAGGSYLDTCKSPESSSSTHPQQPWDTTISQIDGGRSRTTEASESESEAEDTFGSPANKVNWGAVEPLAIEEMASLPESLFAELSVPSSTSSSPSTPCAATFNLASNTAFKDDSIRKEEGDHLDEGPEKAASYQSRILSHGQHAYAAIRPRKQSDFSEVTDELSAEHLAYWDKQQVEEDQNQPDTTVQHPSHTPPYEQDTPEQVSHAQEVTAKGDSARMVFAESDGNVITMKKQAQSGQMGVGKNIFSKRTRSVEDFGSLKFHTVQSRSSDKSSSNRLMLKDLFEEENNESNKHDTDARTAWKDGGSKRRGWKDSRRLSDLFRNDNEARISMIISYILLQCLTSSGSPENRASSTTA